jgi:hypothetical protein
MYWIENSINFKSFFMLIFFLVFNQNFYKIKINFVVFNKTIKIFFQSNEIHGYLIEISHNL